MTEWWNTPSNPWGLPTDGVQIDHDLIDARKLREVRSHESSLSFAQSPPWTDIMYTHRQDKYAAAKEKFSQWSQGTTDAQKRVLSALFLYLYRGREEPIFFPDEDEVDTLIKYLIRAIDYSPWGSDHRRMSGLRKWHADLMTRLIFDEIFSGNTAGEMSMKAQAAEQEEQNASASGEGEADSQAADGYGERSNDGDEGGSGAGDETAQGQGGGEPQSGQSGPQGEADTDSPTGGDPNADGRSGGEGAGDPDQEGEGPQSSNSPLQSEVNRALKTLSKFVDSEEAGYEGETTNDMLKAHSMADDDQFNPFARGGKHRLDTFASSLSRRMGRFRSVFDGMAAEKIEFAPGATVSLTVGNDVRNAIPAEIALLSDPDLELLFDLRYIQRSLTIKKTEGIGRGGMGPIIFCIDVSGSMDHTQIGWAKALAGALAFHAASQGRDIAFVYYSDTVPDVIVLDGESQSDLESLERTINTVMFSNAVGSGVPHKYSAIPRMNAMGIDRRALRLSGGTKYHTAFSAVKDLMRINRTWERADLLFLTDGGDTEIPKSRMMAEELKDQFKVRMFGIVLTWEEENNEEFLERNLDYFDASAFAVLNDDEDEVVRQIASIL